MSDLLKNNLLSNKQYGFIKGPSTMLQLLQMTDKWTEYLEIIIIQTFVTCAVSANILNLRHRQSLGEEDGGSEV